MKKKERVTERERERERERENKQTETISNNSTFIWDMNILDTF